MNVQAEIKNLKEKLEKLEKEIAKDEKLEECNGLMWSNVAEEEMNWSDAKKFAKDCRDGGFTDWGLPTVSELQNVFDYEKGEPKIEGFDDGYFWSSTEYSVFPANAWGVYLYNGYTSANTKVTSYAVRCCRSVL